LRTNVQFAKKHTETQGYQSLHIGTKKGETMVAKMWQTVVAKEDYILDFTKDVADSHLHIKNTFYST
jgi:hypothetical protein